MNIQQGSTVSVCIPTYNGSRYLGAAIESVLGQSLRDLELVIVDNRSQDETAALVRRYAERDSRIRYHAYTEHVDIFSNFNRCFDHASGRHLKFLCADDLLLPTQLEKQVAILESHPQVGLVACAKDIVDSTGARVRSVRPFDSDLVMNGREAIQLTLECCWNFIGESLCVLFRSETARAIGRFDADLVLTADWEYACRILGRSDFYYQSEILAQLREHPEQYTETRRRRKTALAEQLKIYPRVLSRPDLYRGFSFAEKHRMLIKILTFAGIETFLKRRESLTTMFHALAVMIRHAPLYPLAMLLLIARLAFAYLRPTRPAAKELFARARENALVLQQVQFSGAYLKERLRR